MPDETFDIARVEVRLVRIPVNPPRGDAIQKFEALELPLVRITERSGASGVGFGYTIGAGGRAILALIEDELSPRLLGRDARRIGFVHHELASSIHALLPGCVGSV